MTHKTKATALKHLQNKANFQTKAFDLFRDDFDCVKQALMNGERITDTLSSKMLDNREIALLACQVDMSMYLKVKKSYQICDDFILANLGFIWDENIPLSFDVVDFYNDAMVTLILTNSPLLLKACPLHIRRNKAYVKLAYEQDRNSIKYADSSLLKDKSFVLDLMSICPEIFDYCAFRDDIDVNEKLITLFPAWTDHASINLTSNVEWMTKMIKIKNDIYWNAPLEIREHKEFLDLVSHKVYFSSIPYLWKSNKEFALQQISIRYDFYAVIPVFLQNDDDIIDILLNSEYKNSDSCYGSLTIPFKYEYLFEEGRRFNGKQICERLSPVILKYKLSKELNDKPQPKPRTMKI